MVGASAGGRPIHSRRRFEQDRGAARARERSERCCDGITAGYFLDFTVNRKAAAQRARLLIEQAEALGEPPEDPLLLFSVLYGFWTANYVAFNGDAMLALAAQFLALAEQQGATVPLLVGHRLMGNSLLLTGAFAESRAHYDRAIALYDPAEHVGRRRILAKTLG